MVKVKPKEWSNCCRHCHELSLVHGEGEAIQGLRDKLYSRYPITCPQNKEFIEVTDHPEWVSSSRIERIRSKSIVDVDIQVTEKGNRLIIRKVQ